VQAPRGFESHPFRQNGVRCLPLYSTFAVNSLVPSPLLDVPLSSGNIRLSAVGTAVGRGLEMSTLTWQSSIEEGTADADMVTIRTAARRIIEAHEKTAGTWITTGRELKRLKATLVKDTPRGDNTRIGWVKAFELEPPELPFGRRMAEMIIAVHDFFDGTQVPLKNLPGSWKALYYLAAKVNDVPLIEKLIAEQMITPLSTESDLRKLDELRLKPKAKAKRSRAIPQTRTTVWHHLRDGLESLGNLPLPDDVLAVANQLEKPSDGAIVEERLDRTIEWLTAFREAWRAKQHG
jgi:hypothetical protein